jgi:hypothetical protein
MLLNALYVSIFVIWVAAFDVAKGSLPGPLFGPDITCPSKFTYECSMRQEECLVSTNAVQSCVLLFVH